MAVCSNCGAEILNNSRFCAQCGQNLGDQSAMPPGSPPGDSAGLPGPRPSFFRKMRTPIGVITIAIFAVILVGGIAFGLVRYNALAKSTKAYNQAQADIASGKLDQAVTDLNQVVSYDTHYQDAQKQVTQIKQAKDILALMETFVKGSSQYDSVLSAFWKDYTASVAPLNDAWQNYYDITYAQSFAQTAETPVATLGTDSGNLSQDVSGLSMDLGAVKTIPPIGSYDTSALSLDYTDAANQANTISDAISNELYSFENNSFVYATVTKSIADTNTAYSKLRDDQTKINQESAEFTGYLVGIIKKLLGQSIDVNSLLQGQNLQSSPSSTQQTTSASQTQGQSSESQAAKVPQLVTFNDSSGNGIVVSVPAGWTKAQITGGDFGGWKFVNPADPNEEEIIVNSGCVGCYTKPDGTPDPSMVIPEDNATNTFSFNHGLSVGYTFYKSGNSYEGDGVVTVSTDENGYGYVEILLPTSQKSLATQILNSFKLTL